jgi:Family of unknown function (DUF6502)
MGTPTSPLNEALARAVLRILNALARVLLRHGMPMPAFVDLAKRAYVDVALREFGIPGRKASASRVALLTGLTRREVQRVLDEPEDPGAAAAAQHNRAARVVAGWVRDPQFHDDQAQPAALDAEDVDRGFAALVRRYSGDVPTRAVLDELLRVGTVERTPDGRIRLLSRVYIPRTSDTAKLGILGSDVSYLIGTIDHNLESQPDTPPRFQRKVMYDNVPVEALDEFRRLSSRQAQELIELLDHWLARNDRDTNPAARGSGRMRVGMGVFSFEEDLSEPAGTNK